MEHKALEIKKIVKYFSRKEKCRNVIMYHTKDKIWKGNEYMKGIKNPQ